MLEQLTLAIVVRFRSFTLPLNDELCKVSGIDIFTQCVPRLTSEITGAVRR